MVCGESTDWHILRELQQDARLSFNELGRRVNLSAPAAAERVRKLEDKGMITGYSAQIDYRKSDFRCWLSFNCTATPENVC